MTTNECVSYLRTKDNYLLLSHKRPDGDTLGSSVALCRALRSIGKTAFLYRNPEVTRKHLDYTEEFFAADEFLHKVVIAVDIAADDLLPIGFEGAVDLCIDHHLSNSLTVKEKLITRYSSCGELVFELIKAMDITPDIDTADALYTAVSTDTGCFCYSNTTAETHRAAAELMDLGADCSYLNKKYFRTSTAARIILECGIMDSIRHYRGGSVNIAMLTLDMLERAGATENDCEDLAALPGRVEGSEVSVLIRELAENQCKLSVRTMPGVNANHICRRYGGGGHEMAAGCNLDCSLDEAERLILEAIKEELR